jgi:AcrR family transcriptional regulator
MSKILDTKAKIIKSALILFSKNGYSGTSVRDIANDAKVNIAAINYHFGNKENLQRMVFEESHSIIDDSVDKELIGFNGSFEEMIGLIYKAYDKHHLMATAYFRMIVSNTLEIPEQPSSKIVSAPGFKCVMDWFAENKKTVSQDDVMWITHMLVSVTIHQVIISHSQIANCHLLKSDLSFKKMQKNIKKLATVLLKDIYERK